MREAFETTHEKELGKEADAEGRRRIRSAYVSGAAQWILWHGLGTFKFILFYPSTEVSKDNSTSWRLGPCYSGAHISSDDPKAPLSIHRWQFWKDSFRAVASQGEESGEEDYTQECKNLASKAAEIMNVLEKNHQF